MRHTGTLTALGIVAAGVITEGAPVEARGPAAVLQPTSAVQAPVAPAPSTAPKTPEVYSYNPEGRRDPFVSLLMRGADVQSNNRRPSGLGGLPIGEIALRGIVRSQGAFVAIVQSPDSKTYLVHTGDRLLDGVVKAILADAIVFMQEVNDPLSLVKQREVRKPLRPSAEER